MNQLVLAIFSPGIPEVLIILAVILLLFGKRLPGAMKNLGSSFTAFKKGLKDEEEDQDKIAEEGDEDEQNKKDS